MPKYGMVNIAGHKPVGPAAMSFVTQGTAPMMTPHDDVSHPVPPAAFPHCKDNRLFILIDMQESVFGTTNLDNEPGYECARVSCNPFVRSDR
jgi:hypothetical protein